MTTRLLIAAPVLALLAGCSMEIGAVSFGGTPSSPTVTTSSVRAATSEAVLSADGSCGADVNVDPGALRPRPAAIAEGIGECDLVRLKGAEPTDVLIGESGKGQREVQVLYNEPTGREIYLFVDNKLTRIVRPGQG